jgi:hypothetical protein
VACDLHGPMKYRPPLCWWECLGFDGEGCNVMIVYDEDIARETATAWDGITVRRDAIVGG